MKYKKKIYFLFPIMICILFLTGCGNKKISCEKGSYLVNNQCKKAEDVVKAVESYYCGENYTLTDDYANCIMTDTKDAKIDNPCPAEYEYVDYKCSKTETQNLIITHSCLGGDGVLSADKTKCTYTTIKNAQYVTSCPAGYYLYGFDCHKKNRSGIKCYSGEVYSAKANGCLDVFDYKEQISQYVCGTGYTLEGTNCVQSYELNALQNKSCPSGYHQSGDVCVKTTIVDVIGNYYCDEGYTLNEHTCTKVTKKESIKKYSCENIDYTLIDKECVKFEKTEETK